MAIKIDNITNIIYELTISLKILNMWWKKYLLIATLLVGMRTFLETFNKSSKEIPYVRIRFNDIATG